MALRCGMHDAIHAGERTVQCVRRTHRAQETPLNARHPWRLHRCAIFGSPSMRSAAAECRPKTLWPVLAATLHAERWSPLLIRAGVCVVHMALVWRGVAWRGVAWRWPISHLWRSAWRLRLSCRYLRGLRAPLPVLLPHAWCRPRRAGHRAPRASSRPVELSFSLFATTQYQHN